MSGKLIHNFKRKRSERSSNVNYSSDSDDNNENHNKRLRSDTGNDDLPITPEPELNVDVTDRNQQNSRNNEEFLRLALLKIQELENELALLDEESYDSGHHEDDEDNHSGDDEDPSRLENNDDRREQLIEFEAEALGFALCARETMNYLASEGITGDNPVLMALRNHLIGGCHGIPI